MGGRELPCVVLGWAAAGVLAVVGVALLTRPGAPDMVRKGPLLPFPPDQIARVEEVKLGGRYVLAADPASGSWRLAGALEDLVGQRLVEAFLTELAAVTAGPVIPGTEQRDPRYGFGGPRALEVTVVDRDGATTRFELGDVNPITGQVYATGAGRPAVFSVPPAVRECWRAFPCRCA